MSFSLPTYLRHIGLDDVERSIEGLSRFQLGHMKRVAFENLDVFLGIQPELSEDAIWEKFMTRGRCGYCLELNSLFCRALTEIGFDARLTLGRVRMGAPAGGPRLHQAVIVTLEGRRWLADVGFGGSGPRHPLCLDTDNLQDCDGERFRIREDRESRERVCERLDGDGWFALYGFDDAPVSSSDFETANFVCARWDQSLFVNHLVVTMATDEGRISIFDRQFKSVERGAVIERQIASPDELLSMLNEQFMLRCWPTEVEAAWELIASKSEASGAV